MLKIELKNGDIYQAVGLSSDPMLDDYALMQLKSGMIIELDWTEIKHVSLWK